MFKGDDQLAEVSMREFASTDAPRLTGPRRPHYLADCAEVFDPGEVYNPGGTGVDGAIVDH